MKAGFVIKVLVFLLLFGLFDSGIFAVFKRGLNQYYGFTGKSEILIIGSSASLSGYNIPYLESALDKQVALYAQEGSSLEIRHVMLQHYFSNNEGIVNTVLYEISPRILSNKKMEVNGYKMFYPYMDEKVISKYIVSEEPKHSNYLIHKYIKASRFNNLLIKNSINGYIGFYGNVKKLIVDTTTIMHYKNPQRLEPILLDSSKVHAMEQSIKMIQGNNARIILVNFPVTSFLQESYVKSDYCNYLGFLKALCTKYSNVSLIDLNDNVYNDYHLFSDKGHLNSAGQMEFTQGIIFEMGKLKVTN